MLLFCCWGSDLFYCSPRRATLTARITLSFSQTAAENKFYWEEKLIAAELKRTKMSPHSKLATSTGKRFPSRQKRKSGQWHQKVIPISERLNNSNISLINVFIFAWVTFSKALCPSSELGSSKGLKLNWAANHLPASLRVKVIKYI